jgi:ribosomal protein S18 acetylase RimI-like enzyme
MLEIRPFGDADEIAVIEIWHRCGLTVPWNDPARDIERKRHVQPELFLVGTVDGVVVASAMGGYDGHRGWVNYLATDPDRRFKGYGKQIMNELENRLLESGCPKLNLQVRSSNETAIAFYESIGYKLDEVVSMGKRLIPDQ